MGVYIQRHDDTIDDSVEWVHHVSVQLTRTSYHMTCPCPLNQADLDVDRRQVYGFFWRTIVGNALQHAFNVDYLVFVYHEEGGGARMEHAHLSNCCGSELLLLG